MEIGQNDPCPCGSGMKYKKCCVNARIERDEKSAKGGFRFEPGSYGGPGSAYVPSILCQKRMSEMEWRDHFVLVNPNALHEGHNSAVTAAEADLAEAFAVKQTGGTDADMAIRLRSKGYVTVTGFNVIREDGNAEQQGGGYRR